MELIKLGERTYYIKNRTNIGVYKIDSENVYLIDTGNDSDSGKKILKIIGENGWTVKGIINTHSHADHIGGNSLIQDRTNCPVYLHGAEIGFTEYPILESAFLYGAFPLSPLQNKFLLAKESKVEPIENHLPEGLEMLLLKGHSYDMIGIKTSDNVYFLGDALLSEETILKYHLFFLYDVKEFLNTLDFLSTLDGKFYIPSHGDAMSDISSLISLNRGKVLEIIDKIMEFCETEKTFEEILKHMFDVYNRSININQFVLLGSVVRAYLSYLYNEGKIDCLFHENQMFWVKKDS